MIKHFGEIIIIYIFKCLKKCPPPPLKVKVQLEISENANFSLIALKANVPPSLNAHSLKEQNTRDNIKLLQ